MARSFYKGEGLGSTPACAICVGKGEGKRAKLHLPVGLHVWLCASHRDPSFLSARAGRDLVASLMHVWNADGSMNGARSKALEVLLRRATGPSPRSSPGSYSWPDLRTEAEARWSSGELPRAVIDELRSREAARPGPARPPSLCTMRRWFREGRWNVPPSPGEGFPPDKRLQDQPADQREEARHREGGRPGEQADHRPEEG